ncbi:MAG: hypothetical protein IH897_00270, partial [Planctomycetes bacterium]|nr:hypothetical protein [Planctomycetota bacterium]
MSGAVIGESPNRAWTLTGPYGTGKSAFAVFTANLLNHRSGSNTNAARRILSKTDPELASMLGTTLQSRCGLIPITVTGTREPVEGAILRGLRTAVSVHLNGTGKSLNTELKRAQKRIADGKPIKPGDYYTGFKERDVCALANGTYVDGSLKAQTSPDYQSVGTGSHGKKNGGLADSVLHDAPQTGGGDKGFYDGKETRTAVKPLDSQAVRMADDLFYAKHLEFVKQGKRIPLDSNDP